MENKEDNIKEDNIKEDTLNDNKQILVAIEKYISLIMLEFKEHIQKYNNVFRDIALNTNNHFEVFNEVVTDYCSEIEMNQKAIFDFIGKLNVIQEDLPKLEELYNKVKEMRIALDKFYKEYQSSIKK